jgi:hypothetical protein
MQQLLDPKQNSHQVESSASIHMGTSLPVGTSLRVVKPNELRSNQVEVSADVRRR